MQAEKSVFVDVTATAYRKDWMAARKSHKRRNEIFSAFSKLRDCYGTYLTQLLNRRFAEQLDGEFRVSVHGEFDGNFDGLARLHWDQKVIFCSYSEERFDLSHRVQPMPGSIDVQEAELSRQYVELAVVNKWKLTHPIIVDALETLEEEGLGQIDALISEVDDSFGGDEAGPAALLAICSYVTEQIMSLQPTAA